MGLSIYCPDEDAPIPRATAMALACDGKHGLFAPPPQVFTQGGNFVEQHSAAMRAGWKESFDRRGRIFLCPECSGKKRSVPYASNPSA